MNKKQEEIIQKKFMVNNRFTISRGDYEGLPCAMIAFNWSDEQMQELANGVGKELKNYAFPFETEEDADDAFWVEMENVACRMGMQYYEDLSEEEFKKLCEQWNNVA